MYLISVIISVFNVEKYVGRCIDTVLGQTLQEGVEVIIVNDCTPDRSMEIIFEVLCAYNARPDEKKMTARVVNHDMNCGIAAVRNTGMSHACGKYVIYVDSDDWLAPDMLEKLYGKAVQENADITICDYNEVYYTRTKQIHVNPPCDNTDCVIALLSGQMHGGVWNKLVKKELYDRYHITCTKGMNMLEDLCVTYRLFYFAKRIAYVNKPLYNYFCGNEYSYTTKHLSNKSQEGMLLLIKQMEMFFKKEKTNDIKLRTAFQYFRIGVVSTILLNGEKPIITSLQMEEKFPFGTILHHPSLSVFFKTAMLFHRLHISGGVTILRSLRGGIRKR